MPYLNASVLVHYLTDIDEDAELIVCRPCQSFTYLLEGRVDAAILPVVDYFDSDGLQIVDNMGICSLGPVKSVLLYCHKPFHKIQTVRLDPASKTSNILARVLLRHHFRVSQAIQYDPEIETPDAEVVIADCALFSNRGGVCYDMALEWYKMTGFGFVFAVWACQKDHPDDVYISQYLRKSKEKGKANIQYLSKLYAEKLDLEKDFCEQYLTKWIKYEIGPLQVKGMELFRNYYKKIVTTL